MLASPAPTLNFIDRRPVLLLGNEGQLRLPPFLQLRLLQHQPLQFLASLIEQPGIQQQPDGRLSVIEVIGT